MQLNHLLKSPFCVHPDTGKYLGSLTFDHLSLGKICIALDPSEIDRFDPTNVPTVQDVCASEGTMLEHSLAVFESFIRKIETSKRKETSEKRQLNEANLSF